MKDNVISNVDENPKVDENHKVDKIHKGNEIPTKDELQNEDNISDQNLQFGKGSINKTAEQKFYGSYIGVLYALLVLIGNGIHPIINSSRPSDFNSLVFAWEMSLFEFICAVFVLFFSKLTKTGKLTKKKELIKLKEKFHKINQTTKNQLINTNSREKISKENVYRLIVIGFLFGIATYLYIAGLTLVGSISGSIFLKAAPLYAIIIGAIFLHEKISWIQISLTIMMFLGLFYLATKGTFQIEKFSIGYIYLLITPLLWTIGHAMSKPLLEKGIIETTQLIAIRTGIVSLILIPISFIIIPFNDFLKQIDLYHLSFSFLMGSVYFIMHYAWYKSITTIDLSFASALVIPSPAITALLAVLITKEPFMNYHIIGMLVMFGGLYGLIYSRNRHNN